MSMRRFDLNRLAEQFEKAGVPRGPGYQTATARATFFLLPPELEPHDPAKAGVDRGEGASGLFSPASLSSRQRLDLIAEIEARQVLSLVCEIESFIDGRNRNFVRCETRSDLQYIVDTAATRPFIKNHRLSDVDERIGTILSSRLADDRVVLKVKFTDPGTMVKMVRDGESAEFSMGLQPESEKCSCCNAVYFSFYGWSFPRCDHMPGVEYNGVLCETLMTKPETLECSHVSKGAVDGTRVLSAYARSFTMEDETTTIEPDATQAEPEATEPEVIEPEVIEPEATEQLSALQRENKALKAETAKLRGKVAKLMVEGAIRDRVIKPSKQDYWLGQVEKFGIEVLEGYLADEKPDTSRTPELLSVGGGKDPVERDPKGLTLKERLAARGKKIGKTEATA